jgi:hypothetical protein
MACKERKPTEADRIHSMEKEMKIRKESLTKILNESFVLKERMDKGLATKKDGKRADELREIAAGHVAWINTHKGEIKRFYKPQMVID